MTSNDPIKINGLNAGVDQELATKVKEKLMAAAMATFGHLNHATIGFSREGYVLRCVINAQVANLRLMVADADGPDCERAFELALARIAKQLERRKPKAPDVAEGIDQGSPRRVSTDLGRVAPGPFLTFRPRRACRRNPWKGQTASPGPLRCRSAPDIPSASRP